MNRPFSEIYDEEDDIYYVTFKTGEPSYCVEVNDIVVLEIGYFTQLPTGFRVLNFKKNRVAHVGIMRLVKDVRQTVDSVSKAGPTVRTREAQVKEKLEELLEV